MLFLMTYRITRLSNLTFSLYRISLTSSRLSQQRPLLPLKQHRKNTFELSTWNLSVCFGKMGETPVENVGVENGAEEVVKTAKQLEKEAKKKAKLEKLAQKKKQQEQQKAASEVIGFDTNILKNIHTNHFSYSYTRLRRKMKHQILVFAGSVPDGLKGQVHPWSTELF